MIPKNYDSVPDTYLISVFYNYQLCAIKYINLFMNFDRYTNVTILKPYFTIL